RPAADAHRQTFEHRRTAQVIQQLSQRIEPGAQVGFTVDVAAQTEQHLIQRHPRSISTPTPEAAGTAPGLVTFRRNQGMPNSAISSSASRSAKVSTSSWRAWPAKAWMRSANAA